VPLQNGYSSPDWVALLQVVVKRINAEDENESALLFQLLGTVVEAGEEKLLPHIPGTVSNIANTIMNLLSPVPDPWPQVIFHNSLLCLTLSMLPCCLQTVHVICTCFIAPTIITFIH
jgi:hypothetical protein